jgi:hypothetical protein
MEQDQRQLVVAALNRHRVHAISVENPAYPGTPDVAYIGGWIELKYSRVWPARKDTPLRLPHFTPQQRVWLVEHWMSGGAAWLCVQVGGTDWLVFDGETGGRHVGRNGFHKRALFDVAAFSGHSAQEVAGYVTGMNNAHFDRFSS